jgi:hypothetical protein
MGSDIYEDWIKPKIKNIVIQSLESVSEEVAHRKNSCELYGYDLMVDSNYNPWLIEVNSSPDMCYTTHVTERLVKLVLEDVVKVLVDYNLAPSSEKKRANKINTGLFVNIHKGKKKQMEYHPTSNNASSALSGMNLSCYRAPVIQQDLTPSASGLFYCEGQKLSIAKNSTSNANSKNGNKYNQK